MLRRRLGPLGRIAAYTALECLGERANIPTVFSSRHGEVSRSLKVLNSIAADEPVSAAGFSLTVHNAIAGIFSVASSNHLPGTALSAGLDTLEAGVIEAMVLMHRTGASSVLVVTYDAVLPHEFAVYDESVQFDFSLALLLSNGTKGVKVDLSFHANDGDPGDLEPHPLKLVRALSLEERSLEAHSARLAWRWRLGSDA